MGDPVGGDDGSGGDQLIGGGGGGSSGGNGDTTLTAPVGIMHSETPCDPRPEGDLNGDCQIDYYETCLLNGYSDEVCNCVQEGGTIEACNTDCAQLNALSNTPLIKTRLNQLRMVSGNFEKGLRINKNPNTGAYVPSLIPGDNNGTNHINIVVHPYTAAIAHTHSNDVAYKMFSAPDILKWRKL